MSSSVLMLFGFCDKFVYVVEMGCGLCVVLFVMLGFVLFVLVLGV